jgi:uncharacterized membrane protein YphA (DoxX/SURF4 family)
MKLTLTIIRYIVGILFIFSGLVKANDPNGLSYKMQEFFEVLNLHALNDYSLAFSLLMNAFEIVAGVAVILGWRMRLFSWLLLLLIIFFTFLTGYALFSGKIRECGCFGDCIPLQADQSFIKDLLLLVLILIIFYFRDRIKPSLSNSANLVIIILATIFSFGFQWYVLKHLPVVDCLPYKPGKNIVSQLKAPPGSIPDSTVITFVYKKDGKEVEFSSENFPDDFDDEKYAFVRRYDKVIRKGNATPPIKDFSLQTLSGNDTTLALLGEQKQQLFLFLKDGYVKKGWHEEFISVKNIAAQKNIPLFVVTNLSADQLNTLPESVKGLPILRCDGTAIKTAARTNPALINIDHSIIKNKWSYADLEHALNFLKK